MSPSPENLRAIRFEGELLPKWAQLLDLAARLCRVPEGSRRWFSLLTARAGADESRTVGDHCRLLRQSIVEHRDAITVELRRTRDDAQPSQIIGAWLYALDTMIHEAQSSQTCSWTLEGLDEDGELDDDPGGGDGGGDITLRRV